MMDVSILHPILWVIFSFTLGLFLWGFVTSLIPTKDQTEELRNSSGHGNQQGGENDDDWIFNKKNLFAIIVSIGAVYVLGRLFYSYTLKTLINQDLIN